MDNTLSLLRLFGGWNALTPSPGRETRGGESHQVLEWGEDILRCLPRVEGLDRSRVNMYLAETVDNTLHRFWGGDGAILSPGREIRGIGEKCFIVSIFSWCVLVSRCIAIRV